MKNLTSKIQLLAGIIFISLFLRACEDPVPNDYIEQKFIEAYLIVGEPIKNIKVMKTLPLNVSYSYKESMVINANVKITGDGKEFTLVSSADTISGYFNPDTSYIVKPKTHYKLEVIYPDNKIVTGETITPDLTKWIKQVPDTINYPKDTLKLPPLMGVKLEWGKVPTIDYYMISVLCFDTVGYGKYLQPQTEEKNRRIVRHRGPGDERPEINSWAFVPSTEIPVVWMIFKFYGLHEITIFAPDYNFLLWFKQYSISGSIDPLLSSVSGGIGVFGSASVVRDTFFLVKNQP